jgi:hypothetical protein
MAIALPIAILQELKNAAKSGIQSPCFHTLTLTLSLKGEGILITLSNTF